MKFTSGYNLLLRKEDIPDGFQKMSIIQLLRNMNGSKNIFENLAVIGLDTLLLSSGNSRGIIKYLMKMLRTNNKQFRKEEITFMFVPQNELYENSDIYCKTCDRKVSISPMFASRLQISYVGVYHADFEF